MINFESKIKKLAEKYGTSEQKVFLVLSNAEREFGKLAEDAADQLISLFSEYDINTEQPLNNHGGSPLNRIDGRGINRLTRHQVGDDAGYISNSLYARKSNPEFAELISKLEKNGK